MRNPTLLQCFHWYYPEGGKLWPELAERADGFNDIGINMVWLPPAYKGASGGYSVGYDSYDLFDLGEFDQKGSIPTKYGDKAQLLAAIDALKRNDIAVLLDVVVNHKMGADEKEAIRVQRVNADDRTQIDEEIIECEGWTRYTFPARAGQYSQFIWDFKCFSGIDHIENPDEDGIFKIVNDYTGEGWNDQVDDAVDQGTGIATHSRPSFRQNNIFESVYHIMHIHAMGYFILCRALTARDGASDNCAAYRHYI